MSDLESFSFHESANTGSTAESFRLFQERMKVAAAQIQAIRAGERRQRKKEDELAKILSAFLGSLQHDSTLTQFLGQISKLLSLNVPASFILVLLVIAFPELQEQTGLRLIGLQQAAKAGALDAATLPDLYWQNNLLPPAVKVAIDSWIREIAAVSLEHRDKLLSRAADGNGAFIAEVRELAVLSLGRYLEHAGLGFTQEMTSQFCNYFLAGIFSQLKNPPPELSV